jgi:uncharacterized protein
MMDIATQLTRELTIQPWQVENTLKLHGEGATVPFIARYRKEATGNLDETQIRSLIQKHTYYQELEDRKVTILNTIREQGKLTPDLEKRIRETVNKTELEDLYLPYKPKRKTRATKAVDAGLEPLARWIFDLRNGSADLWAEAAKYITQGGDYDSAEKALHGACDILAEEWANDADVRKELRSLSVKNGFLASSVRKEFADIKTKFEMYYDYKEPIKSIPSHRLLGLLRGEREKVLRVKLEIPRKEALACLVSRFLRHPLSAAVDILKETTEDSLDRLLLPAIETEIRSTFREEADDEAIRVFGQNLKELLLSPPAGQRPVLGVDPGFRTGCKLAALDATGQFLENKTIYPHKPQEREDEAKIILLSMIQEHGIELVAIGNGTASRETDRFVKNAIRELPEHRRPVAVMVSESGASVYSASPAALDEFPDYDVTVRGAISIGRRLQDPLSELVKIDPKSIGVGQYQHDVDQKKLKSSLGDVVESCVNKVGVNINLASEELLKYVSGLNKTNAKNIILHRNRKGAFTSRNDLKNVKGLGDKTFEQSAGFLRIPAAANPLDNSAVHPERYRLVGEMADVLGLSVDQLIGRTELLESIDIKRFVSEEVGLLTLEDIIAELTKPGRDPRRTFAYASFSEGVEDITDLSPGMVLEGTVTNVTNFGAFVDIGVHQDGLVHISQMADRYVKDPKEIVHAGQVVKVRVLSIDLELKRIALSLRSG